MSIDAAEHTAHFATICAAVWSAELAANRSAFFTAKHAAQHAAEPAAYFATFEAAVVSAEHAAVRAAVYTA